MLDAYGNSIQTGDRVRLIERSGEMDVEVEGVVVHCHLLQRPKVAQVKFDGAPTNIVRFVEPRKLTKIEAPKPDSTPTQGHTTQEIERTQPVLLAKSNKMLLTLTCGHRGCLSLDDLTGDYGYIKATCYLCRHNSAWSRWAMQEMVDTLVPPKRFRTFGKHLVEVVDFAVEEGEVFVRYDGQIYEVPTSDLDKTLEEIRQATGIQEGAALIGATVEFVRGIKMHRWQTPSSGIQGHKAALEVDSPFRAGIVSFEDEFAKAPITPWYGEVRYAARFSDDLPDPLDRARDDIEETLEEIRQVDALAMSVRLARNKEERMQSMKEKFRDKVIALPSTPNDWPSPRGRSDTHKKSSLEQGMHVHDIFEQVLRLDDERAQKSLERRLSEDLKRIITAAPPLKGGYFSRELLESAAATTAAPEPEPASAEQILEDLKQTGEKIRAKSNEQIQRILNNVEPGLTPSDVLAQVAHAFEGYPRPEGIKPARWHWPLNATTPLVLVMAKAFTCKIQVGRLSRWRVETEAMNHDAVTYAENLDAALRAVRSVLNRAGIGPVTESDDTETGRDLSEQAKGVVRHVGTGDMGTLK